MSSFHLHSVLGRGNFGKVFLAEGKKDRQLYAIKCIKKHYTIAQEEVERCGKVEARESPVRSSTLFSPAHV